MQALLLGVKQVMFSLVQSSLQLCQFLLKYFALLSHQHYFRTFIPAFKTGFTQVVFCFCFAASLSSMILSNHIILQFTQPFFFFILMNPFTAPTTSFHSLLSPFSSSFLSTPSLFQPVKFPCCKAHIYMPANSVSDGPVTILLSRPCILIEILSRAHVKGEKGRNDFKFGAFIGRFLSDCMASIAVTGLKFFRFFSPFSFKVGFTVTPVFFWVFSLTQQHHLFVSMRQFSFEEEKKTESAPLPDLFPSAAAGTPLSASLPLVWPSSSARWRLWSVLCSSLLPAPAMQTMSMSQSL